MDNLFGQEDMTFSEYLDHCLSEARKKYEKRGHQREHPYYFGRRAFIDSMNAEINGGDRERLRAVGNFLEIYDDREMKTKDPVLRGFIDGIYETFPNQFKQVPPVNEPLLGCKRELVS